MNINDFEEISEVLSKCGPQVKLMPTPGPDEDLKYVTIKIPATMAPAIVLNALLAAGYLAPEGEAGFMDAVNTFLPQLRKYSVSGERNEFWTFVDENRIP